MQKLEKKEEKKAKTKQKNAVKKYVQRQLHKAGALDDTPSDSSDSDESASSSSSEKKKKARKISKKLKQADKKLEALSGEMDELKKENAKLSEANDELVVKQKEYTALDQEIRGQCEGSNVTLTLAQYDELVNKAKTKSNPPTPAKKYGIFAKFYAPTDQPVKAPIVALAKLFEERCKQADDISKLTEGVNVTDEIEADLVKWSKTIVKQFQIDTPKDQAELRAVLAKWLPTNTASKAETIVKVLLRILCSRKIPITEEELGVKFS